MQATKDSRSWFVNTNTRIVGHDRDWTDVNENKITLVYNEVRPYVVYNGVAYYFMGLGE